MVNNSPVAASYPDIAGHTFVMLTRGEESYTVATFPGGTDKHGVRLNATGVQADSADYAEAQERATSLAELLDALAVDEGALAELTEGS